MSISRGMDKEQVVHISKTIFDNKSISDVPLNIFLVFS